MKRVVITGVGAVAPNGVGVDNFRAALQSGKSGISFREDLKEMNYLCQIGGVPPVEEEDVLKVIPESELNKLNEAMVYAVMASLECARRSGMEIDWVKGKRDTPVLWDTGVIIGSGIGGMDTILDSLAPTVFDARNQEAGRGTAAMGTDIVPQVMSSSVSVAVGKFLGAGGQTSSNSSACNTGTEAIFEAWKNIQLG